MSFSPASPLNLVYKKYTAIPAPQLITVPVPAGTSFISSQGAASWLKVVNPSIQNGTQGRFYLEVSANGADVTSPGIHTSIISFQAVSYGSSGNTVTPLGNYIVVIDIIDTKVLQLSPTVMSFQYTVGDALPANKALQIVSENNWNIGTPESWLVLSTENGSNNATVQIGVDPANLSSGTYQATITVNDGVFIRTISVSLLVTEPQTEEEYLYLNPSNLEFLAEQGQQNLNQKILIVDAGSNWDATASDDWLVLNQLNGTPGITEVEITVASALLDKGIYQGNVTVNANGIIKKAYITLRVVQFSISGLQNNLLYFAGDRNELIVENINDNSFLLLQTEISTESETYNHTLSQPYFKGVAKALIGLETEYLLPSIKPPELVAGIYSRFKPLVMNIQAFEEQMVNGLTANFGSYSNLLFLKGKTPDTSGRLSYVPEQVYVSSKAKLQLTIVSDVAPNIASLTDPVNVTINGGLANGRYVYSVLVDLSQYDLVHGDNFRLGLGGQFVYITINNDYTELHTLAFENEWGEYELFETKGFFKETRTVAPKTTAKSKNGLDHIRIIEAPQDAEFELNTGYIQTKQEVEWFARILESKRVFIYLDGEPMEIVLTTRKLKVYETRNHLDSFSIKFKRAVK